jgi:hypothetical protein
MRYAVQRTRGYACASDLLNIEGELKDAKYPASPFPSVAEFYPGPPFSQVHHWRSSHTQSGPRRLALGSGQWKARTANWFWFKLAGGLRLNYQPPEGGWLQPRSPARWLRRCSSGSIAPPEELMPDAGLLYTKPSTTTPHARGRGGTNRGSSASQPPVVFRPYPPWVVGAGTGRVPGPKFAAGTAAGAAGGFLVSGPPGGPEIRCILSVGWCPSQRVVVIHYDRPCTAQKVSGGCVRAISEKCV